MESEERKEYKRQWYLKNKERIKEMNKNNPLFKERRRRESKRQREDNPEYFKNYYQKNKDKWKFYNNKDSFNCVYRFISKSGEILRIGSTGNLKLRIANYMSNGLMSDKLEDIRLKEWFSLLELDRIEYILCSDRETAYLVEYNLIQRNVPRFNIAENLDMEEWDEDVEDLWQKWEGLDYYKCKYKALCNENL
ncbi:hypothetical protein GCM10008908_09310 [Clostridium subterminale]|uniref:GIY-YIG domain-containing protein n=1 Tax=Clostridium subterminale TaxID=1550 RepID=A0ABN1KJX3_CLOSU